MKKIIALMLSLLIFTGCSCKKETIKVKLDYEEMPSSSESSTHLYEDFGLLSKELHSTAEYDEKITSKDSFLLFVYRENCYGCSLLAPALKTYVDAKNVVIYTISITEIGDHDLGNKEDIKVTPYLILVEKGTIVYKELADVKLSEDKIKNEKWVDSWMKEHIEWGNN